MKKETKSFAEYKAPKCKCVKVHMLNLVCASPIDGYKSDVDVDPDNDLDEI